MNFNLTNKKYLFISVALFPALAYSHSGGLNKEGCHNNTKTGDYHCHRNTPSPTPIPTPTPTPTPSPAPEPELLSGKVISVTDGDTLTLQDTEGSYLIRLAEIDAPEKCQAYGPEARSGLVYLALNRTVSVEVFDVDHYGRIVGKVLVSGQLETVNKSLLRHGLAWVYDEYAENSSLDRLEISARIARLGLWADQSPMPPWDWRRSNYGCSLDPETGSDPGNANTNLPTGPTVFEFFNFTTQHYFMTASAEEANGIDMGSAGPGWERTGNTFKAWDLTSTEAGALDVCRFYNPTANSHFFTADSVECSTLQTIENNHKKTYGLEVPFGGWIYEGMAFKIKLPTSVGICPAGTDAIHRAYNNRHDQNDPNHRFSPWVDDIDNLQNAGWSSEGVAMCAQK
ncbi:thermonuclease family protein [Aromatoleum aromaticum]|uniref:thermonuclease family protein n=1 Tax=Aromatoleum aromaticum TaxID=551760 RepID=UPI0014599137|nr:thermonuclease family protein [Aromatoleum aromaticum]NMG56610.1 YHYH domain-containing protein [Aromatoleum aromaticum]